jgi:hypothetical protein
MSFLPYYKTPLECTKALQTMSNAVALPPYFEAREKHLRAMARLDACQKKLFALFGVDNLGDLEDEMLKDRHLHYKERLEYETLSRQADRAADLYDLATVEQRRRIKEQNKQFDAIISALDE